MGEEKTTDALGNILKKTKPEDISEFFKSHEASMISSENAFADFMRKTIKSKDLTQQEVFIAADFSEKYGYKLISGEKHTKQRDYILRLCFAGHFTLAETQKALQLYNMAPLYAKIPRDALLMSAFNSKTYNIFKINELLQNNNFEELSNASEID